MARASSVAVASRGTVDGPDSTMNRTAAQASGKREETSRECEQHRFGEQLPHERRRRDAQGHSHRHFLVALGGANQQQIGDVAARHQQEQDDAPHQDQEHGTHRPEEEIVEPITLMPGWSVLLRMRRGGSGDDAAEIAFGGRRLDAGREAREDAEMPAGAARKRRGGIVAQRRPHLGLPVELCGDDIVEARRHHADDGEREGADLNRSLEDRGVGAETAAPQRVGEDHDATRRSGLIFGVGEGAAERGADADRP